jgi:hypothetical protein
VSSSALTLASIMFKGCLLRGLIVAVAASMHA